MSDSITYTQGPAPAPYTGTRSWNELTVEEQDKFLMACGYGDRAWETVMDELDLDWSTARSIAMTIYPFGTPPKTDAEGRQRLQDCIRRRGEASQFAARIRRALDRAAGKIPEGPEPVIQLVRRTLGDDDNENAGVFEEHEDVFLSNSRSAPKVTSSNLSHQEVVSAYRKGELGFRVDHGLAINVTAAGFPAGIPATALSILFWVLILSLIPAWIFVSFWLSIVLFLASLLCKRLLKSAIAASVVKASLSEERWFDLFRDRGVIKLERI